MAHVNPSVTTVIVAGPPRTGTTLLMQMLYAGGLSCAGSWPSFEDLHQPIDWVGVQGLAVKGIDLHRDLPRVKGLKYRVILTRRDRHQHARSVIRFSAKAGIPIDDTRTSRDKLALMYSRTCAAIDDWAQNWPTLPVLFERSIQHPQETASMVANFAGIVDPDAIVRMAAVVAQRSSRCLAEPLEPDMLGWPDPLGRPREKRA